MTLNIGRRAHQLRVHDAFMYPIGQGGYREMYEVLEIEENLGVPQLAIYDSVIQTEVTYSLESFEIELNRINDYLTNYEDSTMTIIPVSSNPRAVCINGEYRALKDNDLIRCNGGHSDPWLYEIVNYQNSKNIKIRYKSHHATVTLRDLQEEITAAECNGYLVTHIPLDHMKRKLARTRVHHFVNNMMGTPNDI